MSKFFKIMGLLLVLFGLLDLGLLTYRISLWRIIGIEPWWLVGNYTYMIELFYGALTIFLADYLKRPIRKPMRIIDLSDPFISADAHYLAVEDQDPPLRVEMADIVKGLIWGAIIGAAYLLVFVRYVPGMDGLLFSTPSGETPISPQTRKLLIVGSTLAVVLPMIWGVLMMRLRDGLSVTAMVSGWAMTSVLLIVAVMETPALGQAIYSPAFMEKVYLELGYRDGLPPEWSVEREVIARLQTAGRLW